MRIKKKSELDKKAKKEPKVEKIGKPRPLTKAKTEIITTPINKLELEIDKLLVHYPALEFDDEQFLVSEYEEIEDTEEFYLADDEVNIDDGEFEDEIPIETVVNLDFKEIARERLKEEDDEELVNKITRILNNWNKEKFQSQRWETEVKNWFEQNLGELFEQEIRGSYRKDIEPDIYFWTEKKEVKFSINEKKLNKIRLVNYYKNNLNLSYFDEAKKIIDIIQERKRVLFKIAEKISEVQKDFFLANDIEMAISNLRSLTQYEVAEYAQVDKFRINKIVNNFYVNTPLGDFPLKLFFLGKKDLYALDVLKTLLECWKEVKRNDTKDMPTAEEQSKLIEIITGKNYKPENIKKTLWKYLNISGKSIKGKKSTNPEILKNLALKTAEKLEIEINKENLDLAFKS